MTPHATTLTTEEIRDTFRLLGLEKDEDRQALRFELLNTTNQTTEVTFKTHTGKGAEVGSASNA